jgi:hypothetical protein
MEIKEQIKEKKVELFDLQLLIGTLQAQLQAKMNELNTLIMQNKENDKDSAQG